ncbi:MAG: hypothetical protein IH940_05315 [Acidobacteria bacterium]|nr:hypothetical protein [Acidobacteriota bacterium]
MAHESFAHPSERQFADLLNFYGVRWCYEPTTFVLRCDGDHNPTCAMTPDFYLPDHGTYVELTTMSQRHVTKKNAKLRMLRSQYPEVDIRVLYKADLDALNSRFALIEAVAA